MDAMSAAADWPIDWCVVHTTGVDRLNSVEVLFVNIFKSCWGGLARKSSKLNLFPGTTTWRFPPLGPHPSPCPPHSGFLKGPTVTVGEAMHKHKLTNPLGVHPTQNINYLILTDHLQPQPQQPLGFREEGGFLHT